MKKLIIISVIIGFIMQATVANGAYYSSVFSLKSGGTPGQRHQIGSFSGKSVYGGGFFNWVAASSTNVTEILGYVVKSDQTTTGYWVREGYIYPESLGADHSQRTLSQDGITQDKANAFWGTQLAYMGRYIDVTKDTWDWIGLQMCMYKMSMEGGGYLDGGYTSKSFYIDGYKGITQAFIRNDSPGYDWRTQPYIVSIANLKIIANNPKQYVLADSLLYNGYYNFNISTPSVKPNASSVYYNVITPGDTALVYPDACWNSVLVAACTENPKASGTLIKKSGIGDAVITYSSWKVYSYITKKMRYNNVLIASMTVGANGGGIQINESYNNLLTSCDVQNVDTCYNVRFGLNTTFIDCNAQFPSKVGFFVGNTIGCLSECASHQPKFYGCRVKMLGYAGEIGFYLHGVDGTDISSCTIEGAASSTTKGIFFDSYTLNPTTVRSLDVKDLHFEFDGATSPQCALYILAGQKLFVTYTGGFVIMPGTLQTGLIESNTGGCTIRISSISDNCASCGSWKMADKTNGNTYWQFDNVQTPFNTGYSTSSWDNPSYWCSLPGYSKPQFAPKYSAPGASLPYYFVQYQKTNDSYRAWECIPGVKN